MKRTDAIRKLQQHADAVKGMGATALRLFVSTARDEAQASSDLASSSNTTRLHGSR